jgi:uncharacterized protein DUF5648
VATISWRYSADWAEIPRYSEAAAELSPVCRFLQGMLAPKASHSYTPHPAECDALKSAPVWLYEGIAYYADPPNELVACPSGMTAIEQIKGPRRRSDLGRSATSTVRA